VHPEPARPAPPLQLAGPSAAAAASSSSPAAHPSSWSQPSSSKPHHQQQQQQQQQPQPAVGSEQLVSAVRDLLSHAGLPLDLERSELLEQAAALKQELEQSKRQLQAAEARAKEQATEAESARTAWQCKVCFSREVECCFSSCGHLFCAQCASSLGNRCASCRKQGQVIRVFI
jgi:sacsin